MELYRFKITTKVLVDRSDDIAIEADSIDKALDMMCSPEFRNMIKEGYKDSGHVILVRMSYDHSSEKVAVLDKPGEDTIFCRNEDGTEYNLNPLCPMCGQALAEDEDGKLFCYECDLYDLNNQEVTY